MNSIVLLVTNKIIVPLQIVVSFFFLLRGHNQPGGGFIAGLMTAVALILKIISSPKREVISAFGINPLHFIFIGLLSSLVSGMLGLFIHGSFLKAIWGPFFYIPVLGKIGIGTVLFFDLGVYFLVLGITLEILKVLQSEERE